MSSRPRIYQLLPRLFGNLNATRKPNGSLRENGCGKFSDINHAALKSLRDELGITHLWLTGVMAQATATDYSNIGKPADKSDLLKGLAGSPYAIKDCADVCPDYAENPAKRLEEFKALTGRIHKHQLKVIIDFVANHVARSHQSQLIEFGKNDQTEVFFSPANNFYWLQSDSPGGGPPLRLPTMDEQGNPVSATCRVKGDCDGLYPPESEHGRVTGNNAVTWAPGMHDWYETVKLNYGYDFTTGHRAFPHHENEALTIPDTWLKMDRVLAHWQALGVDGFRCDMAHMIPPEFWKWAISRARERSAEVFFMADDEDNILRIYSRKGGEALHQYDFSQFMGNQGKKKAKEADLEGAAQIGNTTFWITSHGRNSKGKETPERHRLFATETKIDGENVAVESLGKPYITLLEDIIADPRFKRYRLQEASTLAPKEEGGLNIEGLAGTPEGHLLIGFRSPVRNKKALVISLLNPMEVIKGTPPKFGPVHLLDLGGLGIRSLGYFENRYLIIAGSTGADGQPSKLYEWNGKDAPKVVPDILFTQLNPEGIAFHRENGASEYFILSDDGTLDIEGNSCKKLKDPKMKRFRGQTIHIPGQVETGGKVDAIPSN